MVALNVIHTETGEVVKVIEISGQSDRQIDLLEMGLLRNMNLVKYHVERNERPAGNGVAGDI